MYVKVKKWGNSLALRIPKALAEETGLDNNSTVEIRLVDGEIHVVPLKKPCYTLEGLLDDVTDKNQHGEVDTGDAAGNEVW